MNEAFDELNTTLAANIPIMGGMGLRVVAANAQGVTVQIPIEPNRNDKGTLFAGYVLVSVFAGLAAVALGYAISR